MEIIRKSQAGSFESSDILILAEPSVEGEREIEIESVVDYQFGDQIRTLINQVLDLYDIENVHLVVKDKGAVEPVIRARLETVLLRAANKHKGTMY